MVSSTVIVLMGVSGCGKTTIGKALAAELKCPFYDGDEFHPKSNLAKMVQGIALNDQDRQPWLRSLSNLVGSLAAKGTPSVLACSLLKQAYRDIVVRPHPRVKLVYLRGEYGLLEARLKARQGHYFKVGLLASQFEILEDPVGALVVSVDSPPETLVSLIRRELGLL
jgi:gluconokinase